MLPNSYPTRNGDTLQPPDIEELCIKEPRTQRRRTMTLQGELKHSKSNVRGLPRSVSDVNVVAFCTCQQSRDFPFCDNTHTIFNKATNSNISPLYVAFVENGKCSDCGTNLNENNKLSHSMDSQIHKGCSITLSDIPNNKLQHSADKSSSSCFCKQTKISNNTSNTLISNDTHPQTNILLRTKDKQTPPNTRPTTPIPILIQTTPTPNPSTSISTSPSSIPVTVKPELISSPPSSPPTSPTLESTHTTTCNTTKVTPKPSSSKASINQNNIISRAEVAEHATQNDLWMIIKGNVYDITDYVQYHPGGVRALVKFAGQDGTENVHYHSPKMLEILNSHYFIGKLPKHEGGGGGGCIIS